MELYQPASVQPFAIDLNSRFPAGNPFATPLHNSLIGQIKSARHERVQLTSFPSWLVMSMKCFFGKHHGTLPSILHPWHITQRRYFDFRNSRSEQFIRVRERKMINPPSGIVRMFCLRQGVNTQDSGVGQHRQWIVLSWEMIAVNLAFVKVSAKSSSGLVVSDCPALSLQRPGHRKLTTCEAVYCLHDTLG